MTAFFIDWLSLLASVVACLCRCFSLCLPVSVLAGLVTASVSSGYLGLGVCTLLLVGGRSDEEHSFAPSICSMHPLLSGLFRAASQSLVSCHMLVATLATVVVCLLLKAMRAGARDGANYIRY